MLSSLKLYAYEIKTLLSLPEAERGLIMTALLAAAVDAPLPELSPMEAAVFGLIQAQVDRARELSEKRSRATVSKQRPEYQTPTNEYQNESNADKRESNADTYTSTYTSTSTSTSTKDTPPTPPGGSPRPASSLRSVAVPPPEGATAAERETDDEDNDNDKNQGQNGATAPEPDTPAADRPAAVAPDLNARRFEEFWSTYPKKVGKEAARKAWKKVKPSAELFDKIIVAVGQGKHSDQWTREGGRFIPNPATWLNQGRWDDELALPPPTPTPPTPIPRTPIPRTRSGTPEFDLDSFREYGCHVLPGPTQQDVETAARVAAEMAAKAALGVSG
jgi:hypothetical protein